MSESRIRRVVLMDRGGEQVIDANCQCGHWFSRFSEQRPNPSPHFHLKPIIIVDFDWSRNTPRLQFRHCKCVYSEKFGAGLIQF